MTARELWKALALAEKRRRVQPGSDDSTHEGTQLSDVSLVHSAEGAASSSSGSSGSSGGSGSGVGVGSSTEGDHMELSELLAHPRWEICGFPVGGDPLKDFSLHGALAAKCLLFFFAR